MRVVIGSGTNRHVFEVPRDNKARQAMIDEVLSMLFRKNTGRWIPSRPASS